MGRAAKRRVVVAGVWLASLVAASVGIYLVHREYDDVVHGGPNGTHAINVSTARCIEYSKGVGRQWIQTAWALLTFQIIAAVIVVAAVGTVCCGVINQCCGAPAERTRAGNVLLALIFIGATITTVVLITRHNPDCHRLKVGLVFVVASIVLGLLGWCAAIVKCNDDGTGLVSSPVFEDSKEDLLTSGNGD